MSAPRSARDLIAVIRRHLRRYPPSLRRTYSARMARAPLPIDHVPLPALLWAHNALQQSGVDARLDHIYAVASGHTPTPEPMHATQRALTRGVRALTAQMTPPTQVLPAAQEVRCP